MAPRFTVIGSAEFASPGDSKRRRITGRISVCGGIFGAGYFVNLIGLPSLALAAASVAAPDRPR
jgi:hypothetical protein